MLASSSPDRSFYLQKLSDPWIGSVQSHFGIRRISASVIARFGHEDGLLLWSAVLTRESSRAMKMAK
jgi:hypothetical protein